MTKTATTPAEEFRRIRERLGKSRHDVGAALGLSYRMVMARETGRVRIRYEEMEIMRRLLKRQTAGKGEG